MQATSLGGFYRDYYRPLRLIGCAHGTDVEYQTACNLWARYAGEPIVAIDDFALARFVSAISKRQAPATVAKTLRHIMALVRFAARRKLIAELPEPPPVRVPRRIPQAWTIDQVEAILAACRREAGTVAGLPASRWWPGLILLIYDTGCRVGAALGVRWVDLSIPDRCVLLRAETQKQRADQWHTLSDQTIAAVAALQRSAAAPVFPWPWGRGPLYRRFRQILRVAGVPHGPGHGGLFHRLRRTTASYVAANGGDATWQLGHSSRRVTAAYLDPRIARHGQAADLIPRLRDEVDPRQLRLF